jgi:hypothetical protein
MQQRQFENLCRRSYATTAVRKSLPAKLRNNGSSKIFAGEAVHCLELIKERIETTKGTLMSALIKSEIKLS